MLTRSSALRYAARPMKVAGVIVNYRTPELSARAVDALLVELSSFPGARVFLVDNDSGDGSFARLQRESAQRGWGEKVFLLAARRNGGYGYGINLAVEHALGLAAPPEYFYVINSDAFADSGSVARLVAFMDAHADAGIASSRIHGEDGHDQGAAFRFPTLFSDLESTAGLGVISSLLSRFIVSIPTPPEDRQIDWVSGTSMIVRKRAIDEVGLFDEGFFLYFEEVDYCRRLARAGWKSFFVADAPITHIGCVSTGMLDANRRMPGYWFESRHRYFLKHHGRAYTALSDLTWLIGQVSGSAKFKLLQRGVQPRPAIMRDFLYASARDLLFAAKPAPEDARVAPKSAHARKNSAADLRRPEEVGLKELLAEDVETYERDLLQPGLWAMIAHRLGRRAEQLPEGAEREILERAYAVLFTLVDLVWGIHLPRSVRVGRRVRLWHNGGMLLTALEIGNDVHIRHDTTFGPVRGDSGALPVIEDRADIGSGACVLGAVTVGHDATIGANSVVLKNVPANSSVLGVPARIIPA